MMKKIISYILLATLLMLTALTTLVAAQGVNLTIYTAKDVYVPGDTILLTAELKNTEDYPVQVVLESFLRNKEGTFITMPTHFSLELGPLEKKVITQYNITVDPYFYSDEYIVSGRLVMDDEVIQSQELHFFVEDTLSDLMVNLYACNDQSCVEKSKTFILDETVYLVYESNVLDLTVTAHLTYPDKSVQELTLPTSITVSQIGTHTLEIIASKEGYRTLTKQTLFAVIEKEAHIPVTQVCNGNGTCDNNENYENCPQDCPPTPIPGDLDGDGDVDCEDYLKFLTVYGLCNDSPEFLPTADFDGDGCITENDLKLFPAIYTDMDLPAGWSMISLPVDPTDKTLKTLFPGAMVVYGYAKGTGYVRIGNDDDLEVGRGYWILLDQGKNYTLTGSPIPSYTHPVSSDGWAMIGGCTQSAKVFPHGCDISVIYRYVQGAGYQRVTGHLERGKGYWILLNNVDAGATISIEMDEIKQVNTQRLKAKP